MSVQLWYVLTNLHFFSTDRNLSIMCTLGYAITWLQIPKAPLQFTENWKMWKNIMFQLCPATIIAIWQRSTLRYTLTWLTSHNVNVRFIVKATLDIVINYLQTLARIDLNLLIVLFEQALLDPVLEQVRRTVPHLLLVSHGILSAVPYVRRIVVV